MSVSLLSDEEVAKKFKRENTEQYYILVRMHLSFVLDLNTDNNECFVDNKGKVKKWNLVNFGKKSKSSKPGVMEGAPLTQEGICQVYQLIEFLRQEQNIQTEGIFRKTGSLERQQELRGLLNQGITMELEGGTYSVHDCASVLKGFLAELPDPLLTEGHFPVYCQIAELCGIVEKQTQEAKLLEALQLILMLLPAENKSLLKDILNLLHLTASLESANKMSPDNLAKLFTPHLLCPRKLSPEHLLINSQTLFGIVSFMIQQPSEIFKVPAKLIVEFRAKYEKSLIGNSSEVLADAANTVFTFVDHERTAKETESHNTETELAQLYAHIRSMPESSKKRKLVKKFNKENGHGTPLQVVRSSVPKNKSLGDSIKKHIFQKSLVKSVKKSGFMHLRSSSEEILNSPENPQQQGIISRARLFCGNCDSSTDVSNDENAAKKAKLSTSPNNKLSGDDCDVKRRHSEPDLSIDESRRLLCNHYLTSTPACLPLRACPDIVFTPDDQDRKSMSPITRSTQRMTRAMQETMMTPRSRKPVLLSSGTNINGLAKLQERQSSLIEELSEGEDDVIEENRVQSLKKCKSDGDIMLDVPNIKCEKANKSQTPNCALTDTFRDYLHSREMDTICSPADSSFSSRTDDFNSTDFKDLSDNKMSDSLLRCLDGDQPDVDDVVMEEKELVLKPTQFDQNGQPIVFATSF